MLIGKNYARRYKFHILREVEQRLNKMLIENGTNSSDIYAKYTTNRSSKKELSIPIT